MSIVHDIFNILLRNHISVASSVLTVIWDSLWKRTVQRHGPNNPHRNTTLAVTTDHCHYFLLKLSNYTRSAIMLSLITPVLQRTNQPNQKQRNCVTCVIGQFVDPLWQLVVMWTVSSDGLQNAVALFDTKRGTLLLLLFSVTFCCLAMSFCGLCLQNITLWTSVNLLHFEQHLWYMSKSWIQHFAH